MVMVHGKVKILFLFTLWNVYRIKLVIDVISTEQIVALKRLKMEKEKEGFPITSLREINTLLKVQHENIVTVRVSICSLGTNS